MPPSVFVLCSLSSVCCILWDSVEHLCGLRCASLSVHSILVSRPDVQDLDLFVAMFLLWAHLCMHLSMFGDSWLHVRAQAAFVCLPGMALWLILDSLPWLDAGCQGRCVCVCVCVRVSVSVCVLRLCVFVAPGASAQVLHVFAFVACLVFGLGGHLASPSCLVFCTGCRFAGFCLFLGQPRFQLGDSFCLLLAARAFVCSLCALQMRAALFLLLLWLSLKP